MCTISTSSKVYLWPGGSDWWSSVNGYSVSFWGDKTVWGLDKDGSHTQFCCIKKDWLVYVKIVHLRLWSLGLPWWSNG